MNLQGVRMRIIQRNHKVRYSWPPTSSGRGDNPPRIPPQSTSKCSASGSNDYIGPQWGYTHHLASCRWGRETQKRTDRLHRTMHWLYPISKLPLLANCLSSPSFPILIIITRPLISHFDPSLTCFLSFLNIKCMPAHINS